MATNVEGTLHIPAAIRKVYSEIDISPVSLLKNYALSHIHGRIQKYEAENMFYERKYKSTFEAFKREVESTENEEDFDRDDDLMDWEFAVTNLSYWREKARELAAE
jgi:hypothetical protein